METVLPRWLGFDLDECLGNLRPITKFCEQYEPEELAAAILPFELCGDTWLMRPGIHDVVVAVAEAVQSGKVTGAFLYSNNAREPNVRFVQALLNLIAREATGVEPFRAAFHRSAAARSSHDKTFTEICDLLHCADLPPPTRKQDVAFFDDRFHILATEIAHYHRVPKYASVTPVERVIAAATSSALAGKKTRELSLQQIIDASMEHYGGKEAAAAPPVDYEAINVFVNGIKVFMDPPVRPYPPSIS